MTYPDSDLIHDPTFELYGTLYSVLFMIPAALTDPMLLVDPRHDRTGSATEYYIAVFTPRSLTLTEYSSLVRWLGSFKIRSTRNPSNQNPKTKSIISHAILRTP